MNRRDFLRMIGVGAAAIAAPRKLLAYHTEVIDPISGNVMNVSRAPLEAVVHPWITTKVLEHFLQRNPDQELLQHKGTIILASDEEDGPAPFYEGEPEVVSYSRCAKHFFNPETRQGLVFLGMQRQSSLEYAKELMQRSLAAYKAGKKEAAYYFLGRIVHLLEDCTSPAHANSINHAPSPIIGGRVRTRTGELIMEAGFPDKADPYEDGCAKFSVRGKFIDNMFYSPEMAVANPRYDLIRKTSIDDIFISVASAAHANLSSLYAAKQILQAHYRPNSFGNGDYNQFELPERDLAVMCTSLLPVAAAGIEELLTLYIANRKA